MRFRTVIVVGVLSGLTAIPGHAQTPPDAGSLLRQSEQQTPRLPTLPMLEAPKMLRDTGVKVLVKSFEVEGSTRFTAQRFAALLADLVGKDLSFAQLQAAADRVAALYRKQGLHATAFLPEQTLTDGVVRITVVEGRLGALKVAPSSSNHRAVPLELVTRMLGVGQTPGQMIDTRQLERATLIASDVPGAHVSSVLTGGAAPGTSDIVATVDSRPLLSGLASADNEDPRATGAAKVGVNLGFADLAGIGDQVSVLANGSEGKQFIRAAFELPVNDLGLRAGLNGSYMKYRLQDEFAASGGNGRSTTFGADASYPLLRSASHDLYATLAYDHRHLVNDSNAGNLSDKKADAVTLGFNGDSNDALGGGGAMIYGLTLTSGKLNLDGDAADLAADSAGPRRDGSYEKFDANIGRLQRLSTSGALWLSANGQYASKNLDSSEQFSLGGATGVRAYPALEASGDQGFVSTAEYRYHLSDALQWSAFYDFGHIEREHDPLPTGAAPNSYSLQGVGFGAEWNIRQRATLRALVATRLGSNPAASANGNDSDGTKRRPQIWILGYVPF
jgi:hemolysin activation/secretion protein